jgi:nucleotidyltransferase substrate binding protein (TIGR01987 family)
MIDYSNYRRALKNLSLQYDNYREISSDLPLLTQEAIAESVIQRFEVCFDTQWKILKHFLRHNLGLAELPNSPRPLFRIAAQNNVLPSEIEQWMIYTGARIGTSHDYSGDKAQYALELVPAYINDSIALYQTMSGEEWE